MPRPYTKMPRYEIRTQVNFKCDSKSKHDVGTTPAGGSQTSKMDVIFSILCISGLKCIFQYIVSVSRHLQRKNSPGTSPRDAPYPGYIESCASTCFVYDMKVLFWPFESVEHFKWPQTGTWKSRARAEYENAEIKVSHAWQVHAMPLRNIKLRQFKKWL